MDNLICPKICIKTIFQKYVENIVIIIRKVICETTVKATTYCLNESFRVSVRLAIIVSYQYRYKSLKIFVDNDRTQYYIIYSRTSFN